VTKTRFSLLRGVCQLPAYVAHECGFFESEQISTEVRVEPTASVVPARLEHREAEFAVMPWTRAAAAAETPKLVVVCGSGYEEAALVVRAGVDTADVRRVTVPQRGGIKDLTALALIDSLGWHDVDVRRQPSGDGAIISLFGEGCDAASMVEPYATMMELLGVGRVVRRTGDVFPGAPGCSLTTTAEISTSRPELVEAVVRAFARASDFVSKRPNEAAAIGALYIAIDERFIEEALRRNLPSVDAIRNEDAIGQLLQFMRSLGYVNSTAADFVDLSFLDRVARPASA
jgi:ABC-type nitrate/sulfonate/bicarbonate transport system substrate-binding protein